MFHPVLNNAKLVSQILSHLDNIWDLRNAIEVFPYLQNTDEFQQVCERIPGGTCWGCWEDQPNQLAHMDPGGCLYNPEYEQFTPLLTQSNDSLSLVEESLHNLANCSCQDCEERRRFHAWMAYVPPDYGIKAHLPNIGCTCYSCNNPIF